MNIKNEITLQAVIDALPLYVLLLDEDHQILMANKAVNAGLGMDPKTLYGQYCPRVVHGLDTPFPGCPLETCLIQKTAVEAELFDKEHQ